MGFVEQEAEESKIQLAQQFITLSNAIHQVMVHPPEVVFGVDSPSQVSQILTEGLSCAGVEQAAGNANSVRQVDQSAALDALRRLESRLRTAEDEVSESRLKVCVGIRQVLTGLMLLASAW